MSTKTSDLKRPISRHFALFHTKETAFGVSVGQNRVADRHEVAANFVSAFVLNRLDYCNTVFAGLPASTIAPLQRVQNAAVRLVKGLSPRDNMTSSALCDLHWLPIQHRISYKLCVLTHLVHTGNSPSYLSDLDTTTANIPSRICLRFARTHCYGPLTTRLKFGCFSHAGPNAWNSLPHTIQEITDSNIFKHKLKTFLFEHAFSTLWYFLATGHFRCKRWTAWIWMWIWTVSKGLKLDPYCQQQECYPASLVYGNMWFMNDDAHCLYSSWASCVSYYHNIFTVIDEWWKCNFIFVLIKLMCGKTGYLFIWLCDWSVCVAQSSRWLQRCLDQLDLISGCTGSLRLWNNRIAWLPFVSWRNYYRVKSYVQLLCVVYTDCFSGYSLSDDIGQTDIKSLECLSVCLSPLNAQPQTEYWLCNLAQRR